MNFISLGHVHARHSVAGVLGIVASRANTIKFWQSLIKCSETKRLQKIGCKGLRVD
ncbi:hypothetical protein EMIT0P12_10462 [Pseudomonas sp. IT-P12]